MSALLGSKRAARGGLAACRALVVMAAEAGVASYRAQIEDDWSDDE